MEILFLPNFEVEDLDEDDPTISPPNKIVRGRSYWFFKHMSDTEVSIIDSRGPRILKWLSKILRVEIAQSLRAFVRQSDYDLVISHSFNSAFVLCLLRSFTLRRRPPHVIIDVGALNGGRDRPLQIAVIKFALRSASGLIFHSKINEPFYSGHFRETRRKFIYFGNDPELFKPLESRPTEDYALSIGYAFRDYRTLTMAWENINFPLRIVGADRLDLGSLKDVELVPKTTISDLTTHIHNARLIVLPISNVRYSIGQMTLTQCMALAKPIIVSNAFGVSDYCENGRNCLTYECGNPEDLRNKICYILGHPEEAKELASNARRDILTRYNEKSMAKEMFNFLSQAVSK